jgi:alpha-mannosidase
MRKPVLHLICNAHLDPVWQWRWEEGAAAALATFGIAVRLLKEFPTFVFNHNEAILYRWVKEYDPGLFRDIQRLVEERRWDIAGGWDLQPDVNMPGTEALIRHIAEGRQFFLEHFHARPSVAYNFDSFGHSGGLPQILVKAGYRMYVHMRPGEKDFPISSDLYRWRGVDGSEIPTYRIPFEAYNTYHNAAVERITKAIDIALRLDRDTPVFWGLGDHGGGATRKELEQIEGLIRRETRVDIIHSSLERFFEAIRPSITTAPIVEGDLQRVFTGCYTSFSRVKRRMQRNLGELIQTEGLRAATWWMRGQEYPAEHLRDAWRDHLFNDFHDILPGSSVEPAELDALDLYGRSSENLRRLRLGAAAGFSMGRPRTAQIPLTVLNMNPAACNVPLEVEYMIDYVPRQQGQWHVRVFTVEGQEVPVQEEAPESLLLTDTWRRKICFNARLPQLGAAQYRLEMHEGPKQSQIHSPMVKHSLSPVSGLLTNLDAGGGRQVLEGEALQALLVQDEADSWGMEVWSYREIVGKFAPVRGTLCTVEEGAVRRITEVVSECSKSKIITRMISYAGFPFLEYRIRIHWNEERKRLKLSIPTVFRARDFLCEIPGGVIRRPTDGNEHVQGRWMILHGEIGGKETAVGVVNSGQHGLDVQNGEIRISVLRSALYCHERMFPRTDARQWKCMDLGVHDVRLLLMPGDYLSVHNSLPGLADWLDAPPFALAHFPIGDGTPSQQHLSTLVPDTIRLIACKRSWDGNSLIFRFLESVGVETHAEVHLLSPSVAAELVFKPYEIKTLRFERDGSWKEVELIEETTTA